jgi:hypothetical protein
VKLMARNWIAVASADHVRRGKTGGFMQMNHGKAAPLKRIKPGDNIIYYSPTEIYRAADGYQAFTAIGTVKPGEPYQGELGPGFSPFRRDVDWMTARETPVRPLLQVLELTAGKPNWGAPFRFGLVEISDSDFQAIRQAMAA